MRMRSRLLAPLFFVLACGPAAEPPVAPVTPVASTTASAAPTPTPTPSASAPTPAPAFDPVSTALTKDGVTRLCDDKLAQAAGLRDSLRNLAKTPAEKLDFASTVGAFDRMVLAINSAGEVPYLLSVAHPEAAVRDAAKACEPKVDTFTTGMFLDADVAQTIRAYASKNEKLDGPRARLLADTLRDFRRNGIELAPEKQARLREINERLTKLGQDFMANIGASNEGIDVKPESLAGLPDEFVASHKPGADGRVHISTDYPDYFPFVTYAKDRKAALDLYVLFVNRGGDQNVKLLDEILRLRSEKATMLGYATWADYAIEPRMAKTSKNVRDFLASVRDALKDPVKKEFAEFVAENAAITGKRTDKLTPPDRYYLEDRLREKKYKLDSKALSAYFEVRAVTQGLLDVTAKMYGLTYTKVTVPTWHADVVAYDVSTSAGAQVGRFYLDLYSRPDKYKHAAMFGVRTAARLPDGTWQTPWAALECNFPKPGDQPALMTHEDVVTFFHEFGHVLHHILTKSELASYAGTSTVRDFVEAPSQMFEEWAWSRDVLDLFAKHWKTGEKIPNDMFASMLKARSFGRALSTQRQVFLATLDLEYHARAPGFDSTKVVEEVQRANDVFIYVPKTHFQSSFGHLIGYDAGYYGYQWALSLSRDVLTRFKKEGLLNPATATSWRDEVLAKGGGDDERAMVTRFLGREPSTAAYIDYLKGND